jgi:hypothetical protein
MKYIFWVNPFYADACAKVEGNSLDAIRAVWDALHAQGLTLSARP